MMEHAAEAAVAPPLTDLQWATFLLLALAIGSAWISRRAWVSLLTLAVVIGYLAGVLTGFAALWIALLAGACQLYAKWQIAAVTRKNRTLRAIGLMGIVGLSLGLAVHLIPGFHNQPIARGLVLSPGSAPYDIWLNFDKTVAGLLVLTLCYRGLIRTRGELITALKRAATPAVLTLAVLLSLSLWAGYVRWAPKYPSLFWVWGAVNLLSTCMSEEAFFRGFIQKELSKALGHLRYGAAVALAISAILFGIAHLAGGLAYVGLASVAGVGYGLVFQRTQRVEMSILTHFCLNAVHFLFFTYPYNLV
jgi:CAAX protease family protein